MKDLEILDSFVNNIVPNIAQNIETSENKKEEKNLSKSRNNLIQDLNLGEEDGRAIPTMLHLKPETRKKLMALVAELQKKYQKRFTISQVGSKIIENALK